MSVNSEAEELTWIVVPLNVREVLACWREGPRIVMRRFLLGLEEEPCEEEPGGEEPMGARGVLLFELIWRCTGMMKDGGRRGYSGVLGDEKWEL